MSPFALPKLGPELDPDDFDTLPVTELDDAEMFELMELDRDLASEFDDWQDR